MQRRQTMISQFLRFCAIGVVNTIVNYTVFLLLLTWLDMQYLIAGAVGFITGAITGFFLNRRWTFRSDIGTWTGLASYLAVQGVSLASHGVAQWLARTLLGVPEIWTQLAGIAVSTLVNFTMVRTFVFTDVTRRSRIAVSGPDS